jgi:hypothetical protein
MKPPDGEATGLHAHAPAPRGTIDRRQTVTDLIPMTLVSQIRIIPVSSSTDF